MDIPDALKKLMDEKLGKRPLTVVRHIIEHGQITTDELKEKYGYNHPPRAVRDVKEHGIPIVMTRVEGPDGRKIAAYKFGDLSKIDIAKAGGRDAFPKWVKPALVEKHGARCFICAGRYPERALQVDHRVPYEVGGEPAKIELRDVMLLCAACNRAKSFTCEACVNWRESKKPEICRTCMWASPEDYAHVATTKERRVTLVWRGPECAEFDRMVKDVKAAQCSETIRSWIKRPD